MTKNRGIFAPVIVLLAFAISSLVAWEKFSSVSSTFFFSKPSEIGQAFGKAIESGNLYRDTVASAYATVSGLVFGTFAAIALALPSTQFVASRQVAKAIVVAGSALPILAVAPMFLIWFGTGMALKVAIASVLAGLAIAGAVLRLDADVDVDLLNMLRINQISQSRIFLKVMLPLGTRAVLDRMPDAANAAFLGVFVGEFIAADRGIGYRILRSGSLYQIDAVWASAISAILLLISLQLILWSLRQGIVRTVERLSINRKVRIALPDLISKGT